MVRSFEGEHSFMNFRLFLPFNLRELRVREQRRLEVRPEDRPIGAMGGFPALWGWNRCGTFNLVVVAPVALAADADASQPSPSSPSSESSSGSKNLAGPGRATNKFGFRDRRANLGELISFRCLTAVSADSGRPIAFSLGSHI